MRKAFSTIFVCVAMALCLSACGDAGSSDGLSNVQMNESYTSNGWGDNTYIHGNYADYGYTFAAEGTTKKDKQYMLDYYEELQRLVLEGGGYVESVNNTYTSFAAPPDDPYISSTETSYKSYGQLRFTVQVPNDVVKPILDSLDEFTSDNGFTVTAYNQRVQNYEGYDVVPDGDEIEYYERDHKIEEGELERALSFSELSVTISYYTPRSALARAGLLLRSVWSGFWGNFGGVVSVFLSIGLGIFFLYIEFAALYKLHKRVVYKHRLKRPEYYEPKEIIVKGKE